MFWLDRNNDDHIFVISDHSGSIPIKDDGDDASAHELRGSV